MPDAHHFLARSKNMRAIRSADTQPEIIIRKALRARGLGFRLHVAALPGKPDIVLSKYRSVVFINGCFWHGHHCHLSKTPKTRTSFWLGKISGNISRDAQSQLALINAGWRVAVIWECALKGRHKQDLSKLMDEFIDWLNEAESLGIEFSGIPR